MSSGRIISNKRELSAISHHTSIACRCEIGAYSLHRLIACVLIDDGNLVRAFEGLHTTSGIDGTVCGIGIETYGRCQSYYVVFVRGLLWIVDVVVA